MAKLTQHIIGGILVVELDSDPRAGTGYDAPIGSFGSDSQSISAGNFYTKTSSGINGWSLIGGGSAVWGAITGTLSAQTDLSTALGLKADLVGGLVPLAQLPSITITDTFVVGSEAAMLALSTAHQGDVVVRTDLNKSFILTTDPYSTLANWQELLTPTDTILSVNGQTGTVVLTTSDIAQGTNLYFTEAQVRATLLTGIVFTDSSAVLATDSILVGMGKLQASLPTKMPLLDASTYRVGPGRSYTTIQAALNAIGNSISKADTESPKLVVVAGGIYDEDLTIPLGRILTIQAEGTVILGNGLGANWSSTNARNITADYNAADIFGSSARPALNITTIPSSDGTSTFLAHSGVFNISGGITITGALTRTLNLTSVKVFGAMTDASVGLTNLQAYGTLFVGAVNMGSVAILERAEDCEFDALVTVNSYNAILNSEFKAGMTVTNISNTLPPSGFFHTTFSGVFTGPANSLKLDLSSDYFFRANGATLAGAATKVILATANNLLTGIVFTSSSAVVATDSVLIAIGKLQAEISAGDGSPVTSVNTKTGAVVLTTTDIAQGTNLYFTDALVRSALLTGIVFTDSTPVVATDSILVALGKLQAEITTLPPSGANTALSNLSATAVNADIVLGTDGAHSLGTIAKAWNDVVARRIRISDSAGGVVGNISDVGGSMVIEGIASQTVKAPIVKEETLNIKRTKNDVSLSAIGVSSSPYITSAYAGRNRIADIKVFVRTSTGTLQLANFEKIVSIGPNDALVLSEDSFTSKNASGITIDCLISFSAGQYHADVTGMSATDNSVITLVVDETAEYNSLGV